MSDTDDRIPDDDVPEDQRSWQPRGSLRRGTARRPSRTGCSRTPPHAGADPQPGRARPVIYRVKILYSSATEFCTCPPGMDAAVGGLGRGADEVRQRAGTDHRQGERLIEQGRGAAHDPAHRHAARTSPACEENDLEGGAGVRRVPGEDREPRAWT